MMRKTLNKPVAVLISDPHFTPNTLELATTAFRMAQAEAMMLNVPLVVAGDTLDTKAILRGECVNRLIEVFTDPYCRAPKTYVLVGNHDLLNEKGSAHSLEFLTPYVSVVDTACICVDEKLYLIAYQTDSDQMLKKLSNTPAGYAVICHQGVVGAKMGHYTRDTTSLPPEAFADFRVISGHYHARQDIDTGKGNTFSYIGNPYTQNFGEANDPEKGFQILHDDGTLEFVPTKLRKHVIIEIDVDVLPYGEMPVSTGDLIWLKLHGPKSALDAVDKKQLGLSEFGTENYKLDLIPTDNTSVQVESVKDLTESELFDKLIDSTSESDDVKTYQKMLWRAVIENT